MLEALSQNRSRAKTATVREIKSPTGGWNARDDWTDMDERDAIVLDNLITRDGGVETRNGKTSHATGIGAPVKTMMTWRGPAAAEKLFATRGSSVYNVSAGGAVGSADISSLSNGNWSHVMFGTTGGTYLVMCNGADGVRNYDGTTWTTPAITGVTTANLVFVTSHMGRQWFVEANTFKIWYLPVGAIAGAATSIDFGGLCKKGGELWVMASWSRDGGSGIDDHAVFVTSQGEVLVYAGTDPASATTWQLVGIFSIPRPVSRNCIVGTGADIGILTIHGLLPLSAILPLAASGQARVAATDKISRVTTEVITTSEFSDGWQVIEGQTDKLIVINVPLVAETTQHQYVFNTVTQGWSRFTGLNAGCWGVLNGALYFGDNSGSVWRYAGDSDNGEVINWTLIQAFTDFKSAGVKSFKRIRPQLFSSNGYRPRVGIRTDYDDRGISFSAPAAATSGTPWGSPWGSPWSAERSNQAWWQSVVGEGYACALEVMGSTKVNTQYNGAKIAFEQGRGL